MKTQFKGNPLIEIPKNIPIYNFLIGDFGKEFLEEYNGRVKSYYKDNSNLRVLNFQDNIVKGSNTYSIFLADKILSQEGLRAITPADAQRIINQDENFLREIYTNLGIVLRTETDLNKYLEYLAKQLGKQAKERKYDFLNEAPLVFKASDLELILDENSMSGLGFKIKESAEPFNAPELSYRDVHETFRITNEHGMPIFDENGDRASFTRKDGLSGFNLFRFVSLYSRYDDLAVSHGIGRVVVVKDAKN